MILKWVYLHKDTHTHTEQKQPILLATKLKEKDSLGFVLQTPVESYQVLIEEMDVTNVSNNWVYILEVQKKK